MSCIVVERSEKTKGMELFLVFMAVFVGSLVSIGAFDDIFWRLIEIQKIRSSWKREGDD